MHRDVLSDIRRELLEQVNAKTKGSFQNFFKERVAAYGVKTASANRIAKKYFGVVKPLGKKGIFPLCEELFKSDYIEEAFIASEWAYRLRAEYDVGDLALFERWLNKYINNWAKCDTLCNHAIGSFMEKFPRYTVRLKKWAKSDNRWLRRAAAVTLIVPAKRGKFLQDVFAIADILLQDRDDLVQKGYGWLLKAASRMHQREVFDYVLRNNSTMPRTALRYAIEKMPQEMRKQAMAKTGV